MRTIIKKKDILLDDKEWDTICQACQILEEVQDNIFNLDTDDVRIEVQDDSDIDVSWTLCDLANIMDDICENIHRDF